MSTELAAQQNRSLGAAEKLSQDYRRIRSFSESIAAPLEPEDCVIQSMPDVSPTRWHLAHTTWFFETFVLKDRNGYEVFDPSFDYLFNSYYNTVGEQFPRAKRGLLSRPTLTDILDYRRHVDDQLLAWLASSELTPNVLTVLEIGLNHEQQHQELMLTDIKHVFSCNPTHPVYGSANPRPNHGSTDSPEYVAFDGGICEIGHEGAEFAYDNEGPRHKLLAAPFQLCDHLVSVRDYLGFIEDGGYEQPAWWLSMGWQVVQDQGWKAPLYWQQRDDEWYQFSMSGLRPLDPFEPVCHVSYFEADAFARWAGARLPTESEWELASQGIPLNGSFADQSITSGRGIHPASVGSSPPDRESGVKSLQQMFGEVWQWTSSPYSAYPGYAPADGALGEYNGKFMCGQFVLRGGSCATPVGHIRRTYRNFFPPDARWQFSGIRLAKDADQA